MRRNLKLSQYGCIRYGSMYWAEVASKVAMNGFTADGQMTGRLADTLKERILLPQLNVITTTQPPDNWGILQATTLRVVHTAAIHAAWVRFGRQIFELSPDLVSALHLTDVTHASFERLHLPYRAFFLHFGIQHDLVFSDTSRLSPEYVDGAYIFQDAKGSIIIELTLNRFAEEEASNLPGIQVCIDTDLAKLGAEDAVNQAIDRALSTSSPDQMYSEECGRIQEASRGILLKAASLISNALFYLSEPRDDVITHIEEGAPPDLAKKALLGKPGQQQQAKNALSKGGYAVVQYCGKNFSSQSGMGDCASPQTQSHWRRGHWRNQPHGSNLLLIKRVWIRPVFVKPAAETQQLGRIYQVE